jgi:small conductance mechanosensitive channel
MDTKQIASLFRRLDTGSLLDLVLILAGAVALIVILQTALPWLANRLHGRARHVLLAMVPLLRLVVFIGAFLLAVPIVIEPSVQNMVAVLGSLGLALGFALKDYASSLVAGVIAVGEAPYRNGDWVQIGATYGEVTRVGMRSVNLVTADDNLVSIPHSKLWTDPISNANNGGLPPPIP